MPDPDSRDPTLQRTYHLTVKLHDLMGDAPTVASLMTCTLVRSDGNAASPLFGPQGLLVGGAAPRAIPAVTRDPTMISPGVYAFRLIPNAYYFVSTHYQLSVGGRVYEFVMPAEDSDLITILDGEISSPGVSRGLLIAWNQADNSSGTVLPDSTGARSTADIRSNFTALLHTIPSPSAYVGMAFPDSLFSSFLYMRLGTSFTILASGLGVGHVVDGVSYRAILSIRRIRASISTLNLVLSS